jgi:hypothetical protein
LPTDDPEARLLAADIIGYLCGYAHLTDTRLLALLGDPDASEYELLFSFVSPTEKDQFLDLVRSNEDLGNDYIESDFGTPTTEKIRNARPLPAVLPQDVMTHATLVATVFNFSGEPGGAPALHRTFLSLTAPSFLSRASPQWLMRLLQLPQSDAHAKQRQAGLQACDQEFARRRNFVLKNEITAMAVGGGANLSPVDIDGPSSEVTPPVTAGQSVECRRAILAR